MIRLFFVGINCRSAVICLFLLFSLSPKSLWAEALAAIKIIPVPGTTVATLPRVEIHFSEPVTNVQSTDLFINSIAATNASAMAEDVYVFEFPQPLPGLVQISWNPDNQIQGVGSSNRFEGVPFTYTLDPTLASRQVRINEFMSGNTAGIRDEDGQRSDWIELYNPGDQAVSLGGWYLTDDPSNPVKWRFPSGVAVISKGFLLIWASALDRTNPAAPLHTNFKLAKDPGSSIQLVYTDGLTVMWSYLSYPKQFDNVSFGCARLTPTLVGYFTNATPGAANATLGPGFGPEVVFSRVGGTFQTQF